MVGICPMSPTPLWPKWKLILSSTIPQIPSPCPSCALVQNRATKAYQKRIHCQWNGTDSGRQPWLPEVNQAIREPIYRYAVTRTGIPGINIATQQGIATAESMQSSRLGTCTIRIKQCTGAGAQELVRLGEKAHAGN